jgi:hypothetical protein
MIDVRNPSDGFKSLRARISELGPTPNGDRGADGAPLTVGEWARLIEDVVANPRQHTEALWNVAGPQQDDREYVASGRLAYMTGHPLVIDGGMTAW